MSKLYNKYLQLKDENPLIVNTYLKVAYFTYF